MDGACFLFSSREPRFYQTQLFHVLSAIKARLWPTLPAWLSEGACPTKLLVANVGNVKCTGATLPRGPHTAPAGMRSPAQRGALQLWSFQPGPDGGDSKP